MQTLLIWCITHLRANISLVNISGIVQSQIPKHSRELRDEALNWIIENYFEIYQKQNQSLRLCEDFLAKNVKKETIARISQFIAGESGWKSFRRSENDEEKLASDQANEVFEQETKKLRERVYSFMQENWEEMNQEETEKVFPRKLFRDMISYMLENPNLNEKKHKNQENEEAEQGDFEENVKNGKARGRKRKEPIQKDNEPAGKPELKKTKK